MAGYGDLVRQARESVGLTPEELADRMGRTKSTVYRIESEETEPSVAQINALVAALPISAEVLLQAMGVLRSAPEDVTELDRAACFRWLAEMRRRGLREGGIASYQRMTWTWLKWLHKGGYTETDLSSVPRIHPKEEAIRRPTATDEEIGRMMTVLSEYKEHRYRNRALVAVFASTGIRRAELAMVDYGDVDMTQGTLYVRHGKGGKQRLIGVGVEARAALWEYFIKERGMRDGPLFLARGEVRMTAGAMADMLEDLRRLSQTGVTSHQFRRHAAARMLRQGAAVDVVMSQLGHSSSVMTLVYGKEGRQERSLAEFHELDRELRRSS